MKKALLFVFLSFISGFVIAQTKDKIVLVIDAGHGGKDPGNLKTNEKYVDEKDINLGIALKLGAYIDSLLTNVEIIYTRTTDVYLSPEERAEIANQKKADYFISIHCNSNPDPSIYGTEIHIHNNKCKQSLKFAKKLDSDLQKRAKRHTRGIKTFGDRNNSNILVVKSTEMPAVLIECGFMTNEDEEKFLNYEYGQTLIASAIYRSFKDYSKSIVKKTVPKVITKSEPKTVTKTENKVVSKTESTQAVYKVQIRASIEKIESNSPELKKAGVKVEEQTDDKSTFKYKYFVGRCASLEEANQLKKQMQDKGYKDAFVVPPKTKAN